MKYLITGLGNIGPEYFKTRHNIGFQVLDALAEASNLVFTDSRRAFKTELKHKGRTLILIKPTTYMNLSGKAVNYWMQKENIPLENLLVITDDLALPFGKIRIKAKGGDAGHNGLKSINETLGTNEYARLRFGIGNEFGAGQQINYVLGEWDEEERAAKDERVKKCVEAILSFPRIGIQRTMNQFNNK
ncbi:MAG: aminoacyl-tRNA hydrolase [Salinivirgaceae bacterium]|jgi:PTH1 family peptidyl-tRNA hydrolase|nr:aminoacyl-tRNA hydrolase [Salinivirgaceae bacterium]